MERTYIMVKPDGVQRGLVGEVICRFEKKGYKLTALKLMQPTRENLQAHYAEHSQKVHFEDLITFMMSGPVVCMVFSGKDVVRAGRNMIGATNPPDRLPGSIRGDHSVDMRKNVCHGSDSQESTEAEIGIWFPEGAVGYERQADRWIF